MKYINGMNREQCLKVSEEDAISSLPFTSFTFPLCLNLKISKLLHNIQTGMF